MKRWLLLLPLLAIPVALLWWRGPEWSTVGNAFTFVHWWWIVAALGLNLLSVVARAAAWRTTVAQAVAALLEDEPRRQALGAAARELAQERYSWDRIARRLLAVYELVTGKVTAEVRA